MTNSKNVVCVIGSNSFSGASFCKYLLENEFEVMAISRSKEPKSPVLPYTWIENNPLQFHQLDLNNDIQKIIDLLDKNKIGTIYNFAAQSMVAQSWQYPEHWFQTNCVSTIKLHNQLRQRDYLDKYIHISTPEVYGHTEGFIKENNHYHPSTPYAVSRAAADMSLHNFYEAYGFPVVFTRAANVYGEGQQIYRIIPRAILSILKGGKLPLHGGGISKRSFIHIDDVCSATLKVAQGGSIGEIYHISTNNIVSIKSLVEHICQLMSVEFDNVCYIASDRLGKDSAYLLDSSKLRNTLDWSDNISLKEGLIRTIDWAKSNLLALNQMPQDYIHKP